jgi:hypothetical protein
MELLTATGKLKRGFWQLKIFDVCTTGASILKNLNIVSICAVSPVVHTSNISSYRKKTIYFPVAVNSSIKVDPLVFWLWMFVITENITKRPV